MSQVNTSALARHHVISVPSSVYPLLSDTSFAEVCFNDQRFSNLLQRFLVSYARTVTSPFVLTDESYSIFEQSKKNDDT